MAEIKKEWTLVSARDLPLSRGTIHSYRKRNLLQEGIHTALISGRKRIWVLELVQDRIFNIRNEEAHQKAIRQFLAYLPSNWPDPEEMAT